MDLSFETQLIQKSFSDENALPKALANYMFREIIEDAHTKYNISQEDIKQMCQSAVDRAAALISRMESTESLEPLRIYYYDTLNWDNPDSEQVEHYSSFLDEMYLEYKNACK